MLDVLATQCAKCQLAANDNCGGLSLPLRRYVLHDELCHNCNHDLNTQLNQCVDTIACMLIVMINRSVLSSLLLTVCSWQLCLAPNMVDAITTRPPPPPPSDTPVTRYAIPFPAPAIVARYLLEASTPPCLQYQQELALGGHDITSEALREFLTGFIASQINDIPWDNVDDRYRTIRTHANTL